MLDKNEVLNLLKEFGVPDADYWAEKEFTENNRATLAMMRFLRPLQKKLNVYLYDYDQWVGNIKRCNDDILKAEINEMAEAGVSNETIGKFAYWVARMAFNEILYRLDDPAGSDYDLKDEGEELPRWTLKEVVKVNDDNKYSCKETERYISGMYDIFPFTNPGEVR